MWAGSLVRVAVAGLLSTVIVQYPAAADILTDGQRLIRSAYFSTACRQAAEELGIHSSDPRAITSAFARELSTWSPDVKAEAGVSRMGTLLAEDCTSATALLINVLRSNGIEAELAIFYTLRATSSRPESAALFDGVLVYVPAFDRFIDPLRPEESLKRLGDSGRLARLGTSRLHIRGPSLVRRADDPCASTCMMVISNIATRSERVRTETIRPH